MVILFWFYKEPDVTRARLECVRYLNPGVTVFGLFGGPLSELDAFSETVALLDDVWQHPEVPSQWAWFNGDLMLARWFRDRGCLFEWESVFIHQWDLLMMCPILDFPVESDAVLLTGVRPLDQLTRKWVWIQSWSHHRDAFDRFRDHPIIRGRELFGCIFTLAVMPRCFLERYEAEVRDVPGFLEYRLPTLAPIMGFRHATCSLRPDWADRGDPLFNGGQCEVTLEQARQSQRIERRAVWHPVYEVVRPDDLESLSDAAHASLAARHLTMRSAAIIQVPPSRPGLTAGGAQVVARELAQGMHRVGIRPVVFSGTGDDGPCRWMENGIEFRASFRLDDGILANGQPHMQFFTGEEESIAGCDVVIMFDRVFPIRAGVKTLLVLGTADYPYAREAALSAGWDVLLVPSRYVEQRVSSWLREGGMEERLRHVRVVGNPVACRSLGLQDEDLRSQRDDFLPRRLLFAHRADRGKGMEASVRLLSGLIAHFETELKVVVDNSPTAEPDFYEDLSRLAGRLGVEDRVEFEPWQPRHRMSELYRNADLTLCLGLIPEGFGLACVESILCGTPVLARDVGAQLQTLPSGHGCFEAPVEPDRLVATARCVLESSTVAEQTRRGAELIRRLYRPDIFVERVIESAGL